MHRDLLGDQPVEHRIHRQRDGDEQRHRGHQRLEGDLDLGRQPADHQRLERRGEPQRADRDRHERGLQRLDAAGGNTSFGFQANYSGTNTSPTLSCTTS